MMRVFEVIVSIGIAMLIVPSSFFWLLLPLLPSANLAKNAVFRIRLFTVMRIRILLLLKKVMRPRVFRPSTAIFWASTPSCEGLWPSWLSSDPPQPQNFDFGIRIQLPKMTRIRIRNIFTILTGRRLAILGDGREPIRTTAKKHRTLPIYIPSMLYSYCWGKAVLRSSFLFTFPMAFLGRVRVLGKGTSPDSRTKLKIANLT